MRHLSAHMVRAGSSFLLLLSSFLTGCSSFNHDWEKAGQWPAPVDDLSGRWDGTWLSDVNGHNGRLRCIVTRKTDGIYRARFHAIYRQVLTFGYTVTLKASPADGIQRFNGEANLHWYAGGVYRYEGHADGTNFYSTYSCKYDHGTFQMKRPEALRSGSDKNALSSVKQLVAVTTGDWNTSAGQMRRFERTGDQSAWTKVGESLPVVVGRNGLGWGRGLTTVNNLSGPSKREGDGRSPAGVFRLSSAFGLAEPGSMTAIRLPYQPLSSVIECVDDVQSTHYNSIVDRSRIDQPDWTSSEKMRAIGEQYRLGVVVDHNVDPRQPGSGSCIFIHIWQGPTTGTSGCTAVAPDTIEPLVTWLDPAAHPVLVQLPEAEYHRLQTGWGLPTL
ncbi:MAG TPA: L,D-transpeptidase family protein [Verrucomicrobiae bacterium]|nr:L,D-transpeptidase family protein [Verrucomicrobiae bacterium]